MASRTATSTMITAALPKKPPKIKQACDCCHARKIRCDGAAPCSNCQATSLPCTYLLVPKKKGPKGPSTRTPRAVLKMRMNQEQSAGSDTSLHDIQPAMSLMNRGFEPSPLLSMDIVEKYIEIFFAHKYRS
jgi:Fungal Zn(2)-Cys(6) binuclear cluster domain